jgi:hypothetical protein
MKQLILYKRPCNMNNCLNEEYSSYPGGDVYPTKEISLFTHTPPPHLPAPSTSAKRMSFGP